MDDLASFDLLQVRHEDWKFDLDLDEFPDVLPSLAPRDLKSPVFSTESCFDTAEVFTSVASAGAGAGTLTSAESQLEIQLPLSPWSKHVFSPESSAISRHDFHLPHCLVLDSPGAGSDEDIDLDIDVGSVEFLDFYYQDPFEEPELLLSVTFRFLKTLSLAALETIDGGRVPAGVAKVEVDNTTKYFKNYEFFETNNETLAELKHLGRYRKSEQETYYTKLDTKHSSRLNLKSLAATLGLLGYDLSLTREVERRILEIFQQVCNFKLGTESWTKKFTISQRKDQLSLLHDYTSVWFPEFDCKALESVIVRACYMEKQRMLRTERRFVKFVQANKQLSPSTPS